MPEHTTPDAHTQRPNVLIILSDQLRRQALGCYGDPNISTPNIDALASEGVRFTNSCSTYPICVPFRFTLMTGHYAHSRMVPGIEWRMSPAERTLADEFNDAGYETIYTGKWHLHGCDGYTSNKYAHISMAVRINRTPVPRTHQGRWQKWMGFELRNGFFDTCYFEDDDPTPRPIEGYQTDGLFKMTADYIANGWDRRKPFCCTLSVEAPHPPYEAPDEDTQRWIDRDIELPPNFSYEAKEGLNRLDDLHHARRIYYAMVENLDRNIGQMRQFLQQQGLADNTIIVFISDHGDFCGSHGLIGKQWPYEESIGIPLIVHGPERYVSGQRICDDVTCTEDLFPTICGLAGISPQSDVPGENLAPLIAGHTPSLDREGVLLEYVSELRPPLTFHNRTWRAYRTRDHVYTVIGNALGSRPWQFFDMTGDPWQMNNLLDDPARQDQIAHYHRTLRQRLVETEDHYQLSEAYGCESLNDWQRYG